MGHMVLKSFFLTAAVMLVAGCSETNTPRVKKLQPKYIPNVQEQTEEFTRETGLTITVDGREDPQYDPKTEGYLFEDLPQRSYLERSSKKARTLEDGRPPMEEEYEEDSEYDEGREKVKAKPEKPIGYRRDKKVQRIAFPVPEYNRLDTKGSGTLEGKANIKREGGGFVVAKNAKIYLNPVTSYSEQWYNETVLNGNKVTPADKRIFAYLKYTVSDNSGKYGFYQLPSGEYYLTGRALCGKECGVKGNKEFFVIGKVYIPETGKVNKDISLRR